MLGAHAEQYGTLQFHPLRSLRPPRDAEDLSGALRARLKEAAAGAVSHRRVRAHDDG